MKKMESFPNTTGESLSDLTERCLSINQESEKETHLSNLTAKYNKSSHFFTNETVPVHKYIDRCSGVGSTSVERTSHGEQSKHRLAPNTDSNTLSSGEDDSSDTDLPGLSLVALVAKHKKNKSNTNVGHVNADKDVSSNDPFKIKNKMEECNSDSSDNEEFSLQALASKYKSAQTPGSIDLSVIPAESNISKGLQQSNRIGENTLKTTLAQDESKYTSKKVVDKSNNKITPKFIAAKFSNDSDSDDSMSLAALVLKQNKTTKEAEAGSADSVRRLKPRELIVVASSHRHHTKSESDSFSTASHSLSDNLKKGIDSETSTSLGSLKGGIETNKGFKFSLGCTIPNSFKSKNIGCSLTSSLRSLRMATPETSTKNFYSDPDVSVKAKGSPTAVKRPIMNTGCILVQDEMSYKDLIDFGFGGINLSSAIKTPSISKSSDHTMSHENMDILDEPEEEKIVTLLDHLSVDEEMNKDEKKDLKDKREETCTYDASHILKVKLKLRTNKCSSFGKVVCRQWKSSSIPYIRKEKLKTSVVPFKFSTLSPDDEVASFLKKRH